MKIKRTTHMPKSTVPPIVMDFWRAKKRAEDRAMSLDARQRNHDKMIHALNIMDAKAAQIAVEGYENWLKRCGDAK